MHRRFLLNVIYQVKLMNQNKEQNYKPKINDVMNFNLTSTIQ